MNLDSLNKWLTLLANIGVITGIIFLAVEVSQNNDFLAYEERLSSVQQSMDAYEAISQDPQLSELIVKDRIGEQLTPAEELQLASYWMRNFHNWQWNYQEFPERTYYWSGIQRVFENYPSVQRAWDGNSKGSVSAGKDNFSPEFVRFIEQNVYVK